MAYENAQGLTFTFSGTTFLLTSASFNKKVSEIDITSLNTAEGRYRSYRLSPIKEGDEMQIEFFGISLPQQTATGAISVSGGGFSLPSNAPTAALCTSADIKAAAGELIKGSATFRFTET